MVYSLLLKAL